VFLCCVGHTVLLVFGVAGLAAALGALTDSTAVLIIAAITLGVTGTLVALRLRRRRQPTGPAHVDSMSRTHPAMKRPAVKLTHPGPRHALEVGWVLTGNQAVTPRPRRAISDY